MISRLAKFLIHLSLFTPLFIIPFTLWEFVFVRSLIFYFLAGLLLILSLVHLYQRRRQALQVSPLFWWLLIFILLKIISGIFGADSLASFWGSQHRMDGNLGYLALFGWLFSLLIFLENREDWRKMFKISVFAAFLSSIFAIIQAFFPWGDLFLSGKERSFFSHRLIGALGNPIFLAGYLLPHIFLGLYLAFETKKGKSRLFWIGASLFLIIVLLFTKTRGSIIALFGAALLIAVILGVSFLKNKKSLFLKIGAFGSPFVLAFLIFISNYGFFSQLKNFSFISSTTAATRLMLWKIGINGFFDRWLLGWGPENFSYLFSKFYNPQILKFSFYETWADKPHNQLIEILTTGGILGLVAFLGVIFSALLILWRVIKKERENFLLYVLFFGIIISYLGHTFFAFDTLELRMVLFMVFGFLIFLERFTLGRSGKLSPSLSRSLIFVLTAIMFISFYTLGIKTIKASYLTNRANMDLINNRYLEAKNNFKKLAGTKTPYQRGNWEFLADAVLRSDSLGRLPPSIARDILPPLISGLEEAAKSRLNNFSYHYRLGQMYNLAGIYLDEKYFDQAVEALSQAKKISPKRQLADLLLAQVFYYKKDVDRGIKILEDLARANPNIPEPYWYLGIFSEAAGDSDKAYLYMIQARDMRYAPKTLNEEVLYVTVLGKYKDYDRMAPVYESLLEKDGNNPRWWANIAVVYLELGEYDKARAAARQAIFLDPDFGDEGGDFLKKVDEKQYK